MQIPAIPNYNNLIFSGCSQKYANFIGLRRLYATGYEYKTITIPIMAVFDFIVKKDWGIMQNLIIIYQVQHLTVESDIDYESFTSLN